MKPLDKKDMPKLFALIGLTVCSLGYGVYTLTAGASYAKPAPQAAKAEEKKGDHKAVGTSEPAAVPSATENPMMAGLKLLEQVSDPVIARDPFVTGVVPGTEAPATPGARPPVLPASGQVTLNKPDPALAERTRTLADILGLNPKLKTDSAPGVINQSTKEATGQKSGLPGGPDVVVLPPPDPPHVEVSGVMIAENDDSKSVALLRMESLTRWVKIGDRVGKDFVVQSIRRTDRGSEVELVDTQNAKRRYTFKVN